MEESEKRRERLRAMRNEAAKGDNADSANMESASLRLCNPLLETQTSSAPAQDSSSRFDFYTDPMAAYATKTKRNNSNNDTQVSQGHAYPRPTLPDMTYSNPASRSPRERMIQSPPVQYNQSPLPSPTEASNAIGKSQGNPPRWGGPDAAVNYNYQPNYNNSYGRGRGNRYNSPHYDLGRGRGRWQGNSRGSSSVAAEGRPHLYYKKEMVEDPWKMLCAVIWKGFDTGSDKFRPSKYVNAKKAKVYSEHSHRSTTSQSQPSLAEYLASTVNEPATEPLAHEPRT